MSKSVGIVFVMPATGGHWVVACQQRRSDDSWPHAFQVSCHGKLLLEDEIPGEDAFVIALIREVRQELGWRLADWVKARISSLQLLQGLPEGKEDVRTYCMSFSSADYFRRLLEVNTAEVLAVYLFTKSQIEVAEDLRETGTKEGGVSLGTIAFFADEKAALLKAFETCAT